MQSRHRYFPVGPAQKEWGIYATCLGHSRSEPGAVFPSREHPDEYYFNWNVGRILHEWQMIFIEDGAGMVETRKKQCDVSVGSLVLLPPDSWHRYRPDPERGWTTLWIGFNGEFASRFAGGAGIDPAGEVRSLSANSRFHRLLRNIVTDVLGSSRDNAYSVAAQIPALIAAMQEDAAAGESRADDAELVHRAMTYITEHAGETIDFQSLAESLGLTYRSFRYLLSRETAMPPLQYQLGIRLARAKNLLRSSDMPISEIARTLGFNSTWYFSHFFRKHAKTTAAAYRKLP